MKVCLQPLVKGEDPGDGGVGRVVRAQLEGFAKIGVEVVSDPGSADVLACHITMPKVWVDHYPTKPMVAMCHGLYWEEYEWPDWCYKANQQVLEAVLLADIATAPTEWVRNAVQRHTARRTLVVPHGVDTEEYRPGDWHPYVWWDKTRIDPICDPHPMNEAARRLPKIQFVSTFGDDTIANVDLTGRIAYADAREYTRKAGVYLATSRETFGIATLQAMAAGVPIVGFAWGGNTEIVEHGVSGLLVPPGDFDALARAVEEAFDRRKELGQGARQRAEQFTWDAACRKYVEAFEIAMDAWKGPRTSIIIAAYNAEGTIAATLDSVARQTDPDWECVIVDDGSTDTTPEIIDTYALIDPRFRRISQPNQYLAAARNTALRASEGRYALPLDSDDMLPLNAVENLAGELDKHRRIDIAYGNVQFVEADGITLSDYGPRYPKGHSGWPVEFSIDRQLSYIEGGPRGQNCLPYSSMYRRKVWEGIGGYRTRLRSAEDADFWARAASYGNAARYVTSTDTLIYRNRPDSMSRTTPYTDWLGWLPWVADPSRLPGGARARLTTSPSQSVMAVASLDPPAVAVVIPIGPGHERYVSTAVDSVEAQSEGRWECLVVWDSPDPVPLLPVWVTVLHTDHPGSGVATARNIGIRASTARSFLPLDADDILEPSCIGEMLAARQGDEVIYSDFWEDPKAAGEWSIWQTPDYDARRLTTQGLPWAVTCLTRKSHWEMVGGYDESLSHWEDWAFALSLAEKGVCSRRVALALWRYRKHTGTRRNGNLGTREAGEAEIRSRFGKYWEGHELMACATCGSRMRTQVAPQTQPKVQLQSASDLVMLTFTGEPQMAKNMRIPGGTGTQYRFVPGQGQYVYKRDAEILLNRPDFTLADGDIETIVPSAPALDLAPESSQLLEIR